MKYREILSGLWRNRSGGVGMVFMLMTPLMIAMTGFAVEYGNALSVRTQNQRVADAAAYSAAVAYNTQTDATLALAAATAAANRITSINGLSGATVLVAPTISPTDSSRNAVQVTVTQSVPLLFASAFAGKTSQSVPVVATAEIISTAGPNCLIALDPGSPGISLSGGVNVKANSCGVATNGNISITCGTYIQSNSVTYNGTLSLPVGCPTEAVRKADGTKLIPIKTTVTDPYAGNANVTAAVDHLTKSTTGTGATTGVSLLASPAAPVVTIAAGGKPVTFNYTVATATADATANGCTATFNNPVWTYNCPAGSTKQISTISIQGGISVIFNSTGTAANVLSFSTGFTGANQVTFGRGTFNINGNYTSGSGTTFNGSALNVNGAVTLNSASTFGNANVTITQGLYMTSGSAMSFGSGTYAIGRGASTCNGAGNYSICATASGGVTFAGPSTFTLSAGLRAGGGSTVTLGSGNGNSYVFGGSSDGYAFRSDGGAKLIMASATLTGNLYQFIGNIDTSGGSCLIVGDAAQHDIKGSLTSSGGVKLGSGIYSILGVFNIGASGGGNVANCGGASVGIDAANATLVIGAQSGVALSGSCGNTAFCVGAGFSSVVINAPTSGATAGFAVIGPTVASNTAGGTFSAGATGTAITGVFYMPYGALKFDGAATLGNSVGGCLEMIGKSVSVTQGSLLGSACVSSGGAALLKVRLVG